MNHDGRSSSLTAPNGASGVRVETKCLLQCTHNRKWFELRLKTRDSSLLISVTDVCQHPGQSLLPMQA